MEQIKYMCDCIMYGRDREREERERREREREREREKEIEGERKEREYRKINHKPRSSSRPTNKSKT